MSFVWGHRGASGYAPENTLEAFRLAIEMDVDGIELDVQLTKDNQLVVIHDETIDRTSNAKGWVKDFTLAQLKQLNFNNHMDNYPYCSIPTLKEVLDLFENTNKVINIELKTSVINYPNIEKLVVNEVNNSKMKDRIIYSSFNHYTIKNILELQPDAYCGFLHTDCIIEIAEYAKKYNVVALHPDKCFLDDEKYVKDAFSNNLKMNVWTINKPADILKAMELNVNAVITNYPDVALNIKKSLENN